MQRRGWCALPPLLAALLLLHQHREPPFLLLTSLALAVELRSLLFQLRAKFLVTLTIRGAGASSRRALSSPM